MRLFRCFSIFKLFAILLSATTAARAAPARFIPADPKPPTPVWQTATIDFLLPGYGAFRHDEPVYAALYFSGNALSLLSIYLAWRNWQFYESAYRAAAWRQAQEPDTLFFRDPAGGREYFTVQEIKNFAERAQLLFSVSIVLNVALRILSAAHSWELASTARQRAGPRYEFYPEPSGGFRLQGGYHFEF